MKTLIILALTVGTAVADIDFTFVNATDAKQFVGDSANGHTYCVQPGQKLEVSNYNQSDILEVWEAEGGVYWQSALHGENGFDNTIEQRATVVIAANAWDGKTVRLDIQGTPFFWMWTALKWFTGVALPLKVTLWLAGRLRSSTMEAE